MSDAPFTAKPTQEQHTDKSTQKAISLARAGDFAAARAMLIALLHDQPNNANAWFWLAGVTDSPWEALTCLNKVEELARHYPAPIAGGIDWAQSKIDAGQSITPMSAPFVPAAGAVERTSAAIAPAVLLKRHWGLGVLTFALLIIVVGIGFWLVSSDSGQPVLGAPLSPSPSGADLLSTSTEIVDDGWEIAWSNSDWATAIAQLDRLSVENPSDPMWRSRLFDAHRMRGNELVESGELEGALAEYDAAIALRPYDPELQRARGLLARYAIGLGQHQAGDWAGAIETLDDILREEGNYRNTRDLLYSAHYNLGVTHQIAGQLDDAENEYHLALQFHHTSNEIEDKLMEIQQLRTPPTPIPPAKRIEVSIAEQRFYAYEDDQLVYDFVTSTGMYSSPTQRGSYEVLDKIPMAYASTWDLEMPNWLGIYWSGTLENGIHALPILSNGQLLWEGYLGQPASYGCIILSTEDAETIYEWAEIGTPVIVR